MEMGDSADVPAAEQSTRFLYLYALAFAGGAVAYVPFLTILLPGQATALWGEQGLAIFAKSAFVGAIAASIANLLFGWASDKSGSRRPWIFAGMLLSSILLPLIQFATSPTSLFFLIICWQFGLNMMLAPLAAWAGDCVPDSQKGMLGGLLAFAPATGGLAGALITFPGLAGDSGRLMLVSALVMLMVSPALLLGRPRPMPQLSRHSAVEAGTGTAKPRADNAALKMWVARLFVQIAEASLFSFILLWFRSLVPGFDDNDAATIFAIVMAVSVIATLFVGRWSDRVGRPIFPLGVAAATAAIGLLIMSLATSLTVAIAGYAVFGLAGAIFLALHSSQTLRVLPAPRNRGRDLGLFNLTNTVPSMIMPWLALALVPAYGFDALFLLLAGLALAASVILASMKRS